VPEKLFVGGLPFDFSDDQLRSLFAKAGAVLSAAMVLDPKNKRTRGFGFVTLSGKQEALTAIKMLNGTKVGAKNIYITEAKEKTAQRAAPPSRYDSPPSRASRFPSSPRNERRPFGGPSGERRPRFAPSPRGGFGFSPPPRDENRSPFGGPPRDRGARHAPSGKPPKKPFYQKFAKPK
jgi:RNA recognition motif-containing protein